MDITPLYIHSSLMNCFNKVIFLRFCNELNFLQTFSMFCNSHHHNRNVMYQSASFLKLEQLKEMLYYGTAHNKMPHPSDFKANVSTMNSNSIAAYCSIQQQVQYTISIITQRIIATYKTHCNSH